MPGTNGQYAIYPSLRDRVVLVTGGATGIGESLVRHFAHQGARVAFFDVQDGPAVALRNELSTAGCKAPLYLHCDLTDVAALKETVGRVLAAHGTVDVLVNNAGNDQRHAIDEVTPEAGVLGPLDCGEPAAAVFYGAGGDSGDEGGGARSDCQSQLDRVDDSVDGTAGVRDGESGDCGTDTDAGP